MPLPADLDRLKDIANEKGLALVDACAHAHASEGRGKRIGTTGVAGTFSFQSSKLMTAGEGGIIISNDDRFCGKQTTERSFIFATGFSSHSASGLGNCLDTATRIAWR